jgi:hypothetical protein
MLEGERLGVVQVVEEPAGGRNDQVGLVVQLASLGSQGGASEDTGREGG